MYYSKHNKNIIYINHYSGLLEVNGKGILHRKDTEVLPDTGEDWAENYDTLCVREGITGLGEGFLDVFQHIGCFIFARSVRSAEAGKDLLKRLSKNRVLIRGEYNTFAESFANKNGLRFLHSDIPLAEDDIEQYHEHDIITLRFHTDGPPDIHYNCFTPGSSAGNYGGGEFANEIPRDFFAGCTAEKFAGHFPERLREQLLSNDMLCRFLETSNRRYTGQKTEHSERQT